MGVSNSPENYFMNIHMENSFSCSIIAVANVTKLISQQTNKRAMSFSGQHSTLNISINYSYIDIKFKMQFERAT